MINVGENPIEEIRTAKDDEENFADSSILLTYNEELSFIIPSESSTS
jgi:hypothetical protein